MEITILKSELSKLLQITESVVQKKTTMPILANVLLTATDGKLKIAATDLEVTAVASATAKITSPGSTTVNGKVLSEIVRELPETEVQLKLTEGERLDISALNTRMRIIGVSAEEYPSLPGINFTVKHKIPGKEFQEMVQKTIYAVSLDETRFNLNGVCFELVEIPKSKKGSQGLRLVATDGHRLAMITRPAELKFEGSVIVPRKGLAEIKRIVDTAGDREIGLDIIEGFLILETGESKISMRLIDGEFPDYQQVLPKQKGTIVTLNAPEFAQALRRVALVVTDKAKCVKVDVAPGKVRLSASSPELGEAREEMEATYKGEPLSIGFNARYLLDVISGLGEAETLAMELNGELGPGKFFLEKDESCVAIVMPMRLT